MSTDLRAPQGQASLEHPTVILPDPHRLFLRRAERFQELATRSASMAGYLLLMAELAMAQHRTRQLLYDQGSENNECSESRLPFDLTLNTRSPSWRAALFKIIELLPAESMTIRETLARLSLTATADLDTMAQQLVAGLTSGVDPAFAPFLGAALQVHAVNLTATVEAELFHAIPTAQRCPVCDALPVASVIQSGGNLHGLRYLGCALCATQWNYPRIQCVGCGSAEAVAYYSFDEQGGAVKAEACEHCKSYLKIMNREKDVGVDFMADDIATLGLDVKLAELGFSRTWPNPLLIA